MPKKEYIAHKTEDGERVQTVADHLRNVGELCAGFASGFSVGLDAQKLAKTAGLLHDIGKYSDDFQRRINGENIKVDHSTAGAYVCFSKNLLSPSVAVAGHHGGMPDVSSVGLMARLNKAREGKLPPCDGWKEEIELPDSLTTDTVLEDRYDMTFFIRMLYSCLVDADWLDTEAFMTGGKALRGGYDDIQTLRDRLFEYVSEKGWDKPRSPIDRARNDIFSACAQKGREGSRGLYSLTVPTGGGKTTASLAFALEHAKAHGLKRVFYIIPYTSIIEQNAKVFRDILGENNVLEHHSGVVYTIDGGEESESDRLEEIMARSTENWDMPVVVTTAAQFFDSLHASHGPRCRKLHNLADSVIILDEAQMIPFGKLLPCVAAISALVKSYGVTAVLCTATQPSLAGLFMKFLPDNAIEEICPDGTYDKNIFDRVTYKDIGETDIRGVASALSSCHQALCVVNTRKTAHDIYSALEGEGNYHLSTFMYPAHRKSVIEEIRARLKAGLPCRVVSTSLIEAGVDISFPLVFKELNGVDSIVQAAGRCNRSGEWAAESSVVSVFRIIGQSSKSISVNVASAQKVLSQFDRPDSKEAVACYFEELMGVKGEDSMDSNGVVKFIEKAEYPMLKEVSEMFSLIEDETKTVYIPTPESEKYISRLQGGERARELFRRLAPFSVSLLPKQYDGLCNGGFIEKLPDIDSAVLVDKDKYSAETGLDADRDLGRDIII